MIPSIQLDDYGTAIRLKITDDGIVTDISEVSTKQIILFKPGGDKITKDASFVTDGTDGQMQYILSSGDINECGAWKAQGYIEIGSNRYHTSKKTFKVNRNL